MAADMALSNISTMTGEFSRAVLILILQFLKVAYFCSPDPFAAMFSLSSLFLSFKRAYVTSWHFMIGWSRRWIISSFSYEALSIWDALVMSHLTTVSAMGELSLVPRTISLASPSFVVTLRNGDMPISLANSSGALSTFADLFTLYWACPNSCFSFISKENLSSNGIWLSYRGRETEFGCHTAGVKRNLVVIPRAWNGIWLSYRGCFRRFRRFPCPLSGDMPSVDVTSVNESRLNVFNMLAVNKTVAFDLVRVLDDVRMCVERPCVCSFSPRMPVHVDSFTRVNLNDPRAFTCFVRLEQEVMLRCGAD